MYAVANWYTRRVSSTVKQHVSFTVQHIFSPTCVHTRIRCVHPLPVGGATPSIGDVMSREWPAHVLNDGHQFIFNLSRAWGWLTQKPAGVEREGKSDVGIVFEHGSVREPRSAVEVYAETVGRATKLQTLAKLTLLLYSSNLTHTHTHTHKKKVQLNEKYSLSFSRKH